MLGGEMGALALAARGVAARQGYAGLCMYEWPRPRRRRWVR